MTDPGSFIPPMLAVTADEPFDAEDWWYEVKWDGYRAIVSMVDNLKIFSRGGHDLLAWYPDLQKLADLLPSPVVLDCEVVAWVDGRPSFERLLERASVPHLAMVFDCLYSDGKWHLHEPLRDRRRRLTHMLQPQGMLVVPEGVEGRGRDYWEACGRQGLEGVMAKRLDSTYLPGRRSRLWQKFLVYQTAWFNAVAGHRTEDGRWYWDLRDISSTGGRVGRVAAPRDWQGGAQDVSDVVFRGPIAVEVQYRERTEEGRLRHARIRQWALKRN